MEQGNDGAATPSGVLREGPCGGRVLWTSAPGAGARGGCWEEPLRQVNIKGGTLGNSPSAAGQEKRIENPVGDVVLVHWCIARGKVGEYFEHEINRFDALRLLISPRFVLKVEDIVFDSSSIESIGLPQPVVEETSSRDSTGCIPKEESSSLR